MVCRPIDLNGFVMNLFARKEQRITRRSCLAEFDRSLLVGSEGQLVDVVPQLGGNGLERVLCHADGGTCAQGYQAGYSATVATGATEVSGVLLLMLVGKQNFEVG